MEAGYSTPSFLEGLGEAKQTEFPYPPTPTASLSTVLLLSVSYIELLWLNEFDNYLESSILRLLPGLKISRLSLHLT